MKLGAQFFFIILTNHAQASKADPKLYWKNEALLTSKKVKYSQSIERLSVSKVRVRVSFAISTPG